MSTFTIADVERLLAERELDTATDLAALTAKVSELAGKYGNSNTNLVSSRACPTTFLSSPKPQLTRHPSTLAPPTTAVAHVRGHPSLLHAGRFRVS